MAGVPGLLRAIALVLRISCAVQACTATLLNLFGSHPGYPDFTYLNNLHQYLAIITFNMAGVPGFEPGNAGIKIQCLTAWRYPN